MGKVFEIKESQLNDLMIYVQSQLTYNQAIPIVNWCQNIIQENNNKNKKGEEND